MARGQNAVQRMGGEGRKDAIAFRPEDLVIVTDPKHPLYDERATMPLDEGMIANIKRMGVLQPIIVRHNGEKDGRPVVEVVAGRQRVRSAIEANKQLRAEGQPEIYVYAVVQRGNDVKLFEVGISENEGRQDTDVMNRARNMQRYLDMGRDEDDISVIFKCTKQMVRYTLALLDLHPKVQKAVVDGVISASLASKELSTLEKDAQVETLEKLIATGVTKGAGALERTKRLKKGEVVGGKDDETIARVRNRAFLERFSTLLRKRGDTPTAALVDFILGSDTALRNYSEWKEVAEEAGWKRRK